MTFVAGQPGIGGGGRHIKLTVAYDGTDYVGWQRQRNGVSVQARLEQALEEFEGGPVTVTGAGRTDAGVHALGQVAAVRLSHPIETAVLGRALNAKLPADIRVTNVELAGAQFDARRDARAKTYRYRIVSGEIVSPFERRYAWHVRQALDDAAMREAGSVLRGQHDFAAFRATGGSATTTVRTIFRFELDRLQAAPPPTASYHGLLDGSLLTIDIQGDGFLRHMVRVIVGTLVEVGTGRRRPTSLERALRLGERTDAGPTAPARGLFLIRVTYSPLGPGVDA